MPRLRDKNLRFVDDRYFKSGGVAGDVGPLPRWISYSVLYSDVAAAATTGTKDICTLPAGTIVHDAFLRLDTEFAGGAVSAATLAVGDSGDADRLIEEANVFTAAGTGRKHATTGPTRGVGLYDPTAGDQSPLFGYDVGTSALAIRVTVVTTTANTNALTAGAATVFLLVSQPEEACTLAAGVT